LGFAEYYCDRPAGTARTADYLISIGFNPLVARDERARRA